MRVALVGARFYPDLLAELVAGAGEALDAAGASHDCITVPGAFEIPAAVVFANASASPFDAYVALGAVIRGETSHYDIVSQCSAQSLARLAVDRKLALGNGILTCETLQQAWHRARRSQLNAGAAAATAALEMARLRKRLVKP